MLRNFFAALALAGLLLLAFPPFCEPAKPAVRILEADLTGAVTPLQQEFLRRALDQARDQGCDALLLRLDTPGGLLDSMRAMVKDMLNAPLPVLVWVGPKGAQAASAGVFLVAASDLAGMAPQATIGSASPVAPGGEDLNQTLKTKVMADLESLVRGAALARGRNADWYERAVSESVSLTAQEAVLQKVVEVLADDPLDFLEQAGKRGLERPGGALRFTRDQVVVERLEPSLRDRLLSWVLHPQVAYFLFLGGLAGLFFEITTPGAVLPGVLGGLALLLALYAMSVLPTRAAGLGLVLLGLLFFWLEIKITSFGLLGLAAVAALFLGSLLLFEPGTGLPGLPLSTVIVTVAGLSALLAGIVALVVRSQRSRQVTGDQAMLGLAAEVLDWSGDRGQVRVRGEIWAARSDAPLVPGGRAVVIGQSGLTLVLAPEQAPFQNNPSHEP
jgi:membrane-bound serine protease (ClpP class)